jgi:hypothetical protein
VLAKGEDYVGAAEFTLESALAASPITSTQADDKAMSVI